jgi:hypothetical protein
MKIILRLLVVVVLASLFCRAGEEAARSAPELVVVPPVEPAGNLDFDVGKFKQDPLRARFDIHLKDGRVLKSARIKSTTARTITVHCSEGLISVRKELFPDAVQKVFPVDAQMVQAEEERAAMLRQQEAVERKAREERERQRMAAEAELAAQRAERDRVAGPIQPKSSYRVSYRVTGRALTADAHFTSGTDRSKSEVVKPGRAWSYDWTGHPGDMAYLSIQLPSRGGETTISIYVDDVEVQTEKVRDPFKIATVHMSLP